MEPADSVRQRKTFNQGKDKQDLMKSFSDALDDFKSHSVNGNITLHFSWGAVAKIHVTRVY